MFKKILFPVDVDAEASMEALPAAGDMARKFGAELTLLNVQAPVPPMIASYMPEGYPDETDKMAKSRLAKLVDEYKLGAGTAVEVRHGTPYHEILEFAEADGVDLILLASHQPALSDYLLGSTAGQVVRHAKVSVLVLRV